MAGRDNIWKLARRCDFLKVVQFEPHDIKYQVSRSNRVAYFKWLKLLEDLIEVFNHHRTSLSRVAFINK